MMLFGGLAVLAGEGQTARSAASGGAPFGVEASAGRQAGSRIDARVTRVVDGVRVTLPAAVVPALEPGDVVDVRFPDYTRPPARANYHTNVAFITEVAPQRWLFEQSGAADRLFTVEPRGRHRPTVPAPAPGLRFTYGTADHRGIPIFFIVPEDGKTRGMDGVRDYVNAHPTDFKDMAQSANDAADRYVWFQDFLSSLSNGSIDPVSGRQRVESVAVSLGANPATVDACYTSGGSGANVADCVKNSLNAVNYQTNIEAPTQAQFFGGAFGAAAPVQLASYLIPLLSVWKLFVSTGHREYEYLPTTLTVVPQAQSVSADRELLMGLKVPSLRPPAAYSDALFFTIGDPQAAASPPSVANTADPNGLCVPAPRMALPLHLDRTSTFVHDTQLVVTPEGGHAYTIAVDPRSLDTPVIDAAALTGAATGAYTVRLTGRFGFDPIAQPPSANARIVVPQSATWSVAAQPHQRAIAGETLNFVASSAAAPCLSRAELQIGNAAPIPLDLKRLSERRVALHASLANVPPGDAHLHLYQADPLHDADIENDVAVAIGGKPAQVDPAKAVAYLADGFIELSGAELETAAFLRFNGATYIKDAGSSATDACFSGPPVGGAGLVAGQSISTQLIQSDGSPGQVFVTKLAPARPRLQPPAVAPDVPQHTSTQPLAITLATAGRDLPVRREIRVRRAVPDATPCAAAHADTGAYAVVPQTALYEQSAGSLVVNLDAAQTLNDRAFGVLQVQLADTAAGSASDWVRLPGSFIRAPRVNRIECPLDPALTCALLGTGLGAIAGVRDVAGKPVRPDVRCTSPDKNFACVAVPHLAQYILELEDAHATMTVPPSQVTIGNPSSAPARTPPSAPSPASSAGPARPDSPAPAAPPQAR